MDNQSNQPAFGYSDKFPDTNTQLNSDIDEHPFNYTDIHLDPHFNCVLYTCSGLFAWIWSKPGGPGRWIDQPGTDQ
jgi:hypothetical protein